MQNITPVKKTNRKKNAGSSNTVKDNIIQIVPNNTNTPARKCLKYLKYIFLC